MVHQHKTPPPVIQPLFPTTSFHPRAHRKALKSSLYRANWGKRKVKIRVGNFHRLLSHTFHHLPSPTCNPSESPLTWEMLRHFNFLRRFTGAGSRRWFSTDVNMTTQSSTAVADEAFVQAWRNAIPNLEPPKTPLLFANPRPPRSSDIPSKLTVNFVLPYSSELSHKEVDMVTIPATTGQMGILPGHVPTIAELQPGVLSIEETSGVKKYFVSSGFVFIHSNSFADIVAAEAVPIDHLDVTLVQKGLAEFTQKLNSASTDLERAEAEIGVTVHSALNSALKG